MKKITLLLSLLIFDSTVFADITSSGVTLREISRGEYSINFGDSANKEVLLVSKSNKGFMSIFRSKHLISIHPTVFAIENAFAVNSVEICSQENLSMNRFDGAHHFFVDKDLDRYSSKKSKCVVNRLAKYEQRYTSPRSESKIEDLEINLKEIRFSHIDDINDIELKVIDDAFK